MASPEDARATAGERADVAAIVLTHDEAVHVRRCLESLREWCAQVFVVDSDSADATVQLAAAAIGENAVFVHPFEGYARQRNWALDNLPISTEWILFVDADEIVTPELRRDICRRLASPEARGFGGFHIRLRLVFMGRTMRHGARSSWLLRLYRRGRGRLEERSVNEHAVVAGKLGYLEGDLLHENLKGLAEWSRKHIRYAELEAAELVRFARGTTAGAIPGRLIGATQAERKRWIRHRVWNRLPPALRPVCLFAYVYFLRLGILDGRQGFILAVLWAIWFPTLIDALVLEQIGEPSRNAAEPDPPEGRSGVH